MDSDEQQNIDIQPAENPDVVVAAPPAEDQPAGNNDSLDVEGVARNREPSAASFSPPAVVDIPRSETDGFGFNVNQTSDNADVPAVIVEEGAFGAEPARLEGGDNATPAVDAVDLLPSPPSDAGVPDDIESKPLRMDSPPQRMIEIEERIPQPPKLIYPPRPKLPVRSARVPVVKREFATPFPRSLCCTVPACLYASSGIIIVLNICFMVMNQMLATATTGTSDAQNPAAFGVQIALGVVSILVYGCVVSATFMLDRRLLNICAYAIGGIFLMTMFLQVILYFSLDFEGLATELNAQLLEQGYDLQYYSIGVPQLQAAMVTQILIRLVLDFFFSLIVIHRLNALKDWSDAETKAKRPLMKNY